jgi:arabinogalactan endo-1,4-beta-galactosidase
MRRFGNARRVLSLMAAALGSLGMVAGSAGPARAVGAPVAIRGADISSLKKTQDLGGVYYDPGGVRRDALDILRSSGVNYARLRVWVNPADGYNDKARVLDMARQVKARGMGLLIDFHYSDTWADPGWQSKPAAWASLDFTQLQAAVQDHTADVLGSLRAQGTTADMVQIGNEINNGMLWPDGSTSNWANLAALLKAGVAGARAASPDTRVMLHVSNGGDNPATRAWLDQAVAYGVPFDVIGVSHYVYWHGSLASLQANLNDVAARYGRPVLVAETAYGFTLAQSDAQPNIFDAGLQQAGGYPATPDGQAAMLRAIFAVVRAVPNGRGLGVFYWEPTWTAVPGNGVDPANPRSGDVWENQAMFDYADRALPALSVFASFS